MPPVTPPIRGIPQTFFTDTGASTRNQDGSLSRGGNTYYAFFGDTDWVLDTAANQSSAPRARFTSPAFDTIKNGSYNSGGSYVTYNGKNYKFSFIQDSANADKNLIDIYQI